jgi:hypothetical protein
MLILVLLEIFYIVYFRHSNSEWYTPSSEALDYIYRIFVWINYKLHWNMFYEFANFNV